MDKREREWEAKRKAVEFADQRIGVTPRDRLAWAVRIVQTPQRGMTPGDWENLRLELEAFALNIPHMRGFDFYASGVSIRSSGVGQPTQEEAKKTLERMGPMIEAAVKRDPVKIGPVKADLFLFWETDWPPNASPQWRARWANVEMSWPERAAHALAGLIGQAGHLLKECPAPAKRGGEGETCGNWFVAKRPNQDYCSATCQSRASTRAARAGTETPATQRRREAQKKKEG